MCSQGREGTVRMWALAADGSLPDKCADKLTTETHSATVTCGVPFCNPAAFGCCMHAIALMPLMPCVRREPLREFCTKSYTFCRMSVLLAGACAPTEVI